MIEKLWMALSLWDIAYFIIACATLAVLAVSNENFEAADDSSKFVISIFLSILWPLTWIVIFFVVTFIIIHDVFDIIFKKGKK